MDYLFQDGGKPKKPKTTKPKTKSKTTKKGGNFLGTVGDLVAPTGWGPFATAAALVGLDRVDAALRRGKSTKSSAKKGGMRGGDPVIKSGNILLNRKGANQLRGLNPNGRAELLVEKRFGNHGELPSIPIKTVKSNIYTNSSGAPKGYTNKGNQIILNNQEREKRLKQILNEKKKIRTN
jgi:hypothetical protein